MNHFPYLRTRTFSLPSLFLSVFFLAAPAFFLFGAAAEVAAQSAAAAEGETLSHSLFAVRPHTGASAAPEVPAGATTTASAPALKRLVKRTSSVRRFSSSIGSSRRMVITGEDIRRAIAMVSLENTLPPRLIESLVEIESRGRICANSPVGARGITQLMPATARRFGLMVSNEYDERCDYVKALRVGAVYLRWLIDYFNGDVRLALAGYNAGEGAVDRWGGRIPPYKETILYVENILMLYTGKPGLSLERSYNFDKSRRLIQTLPRYRQMSSFPAAQAAILPSEASSEAVTVPGHSDPSTPVREEYQHRVSAKSVFYMEVKPEAPKPAATPAIEK